MRDHDTLGLTRGSRSEHEVAQIIGAGFVYASVNRFNGHHGARIEVVLPRGRAFGSVALNDDDATVPFNAGASQHADVVVAEETVDAQEHLGARTTNDVGGFHSLITGVQRHQHRTGHHGTKARDDPLGNIRRPDGDLVALLDPSGNMGPGRIDDATT